MKEKAKDDYTHELLEFLRANIYVMYDMIRAYL
jgi:hypothetical protein